MALISCPECEKQVSTQAPSCPSCGVPIASREETRAAGAPLTTIQGTSKRLKMHSLISGLMFGVGSLGSYFALQDFDPAAGDSLGIWSLLVVIGLAWFIVTRIRIWWHHD